jgi:hypothetical protein
MPTTKVAGRASARAARSAMVVVFFILDSIKSFKYVGSDAWLL